MNEELMRLDEVSLTYKTNNGLFSNFRHQALSGVSFSVFKGEILGILGLNGSGKSSLLKVMSGILHPDSGEVVLGEGVTRSLLSLGLGFKGTLSGRDNTLLSCMLNGLTRQDALAKIEEIKAFSELGDFFEQPVKTYSSGMRSKLGFTTGLILDVDILLIDEVLSVGDHTFKKKAESTLLEKMKGHQTVIFVSHNAGQINRLCNRCVWLENGKVKMKGDTAEIMKIYDSEKS